MKLVIRDRRIVRMSKSITRNEFSGTYIGMTTISLGVQRRFFSSMRSLIEAGSVNEFFNVAVHDFADKGVMIGSTSTAGLPWAEIDDPADFPFCRAHVFPRLCV